MKLKKNANQEINVNDIVDLIKKCEFDPQRIGIEILKFQGYTVNTYVFSDSIYVYDSIDKNKIVYWR